MLARFIPAVRTFVPIAAGTARMSYRKFLMWNVLGGIGWVVSMTLGGYYLTEMIQSSLGIAEKDIDKVLLPIIFIIIVVSALPWPSTTCTRRTASWSTARSASGSGGGRPSSPTHGRTDGTLPAVPDSLGRSSGPVAARRDFLSRRPLSATVRCCPRQAGKVGLPSLR